MNEKALIYLISCMEKKLKELMPEDEYAGFSRRIAAEAFRIEMEEMADGKFKDFVLENWDDIVKGVDTHES